MTIFGFGKKKQQQEFQYSAYSEQENCDFCQDLVFAKMKKCKECSKKIICKFCYKQGGLCTNCDKKYQEQMKLYFGEKVVEQV